MTPKEKAIKLVDRFYEITNLEGYYEEFQESKQCALICVDEILNQKYLLSGFTKVIEYWEEVKQEINKM
jgi:hypothetical protein